MSKPNPSITSGAAKAPGAISAGAKRKKIIFTVIKIVAVIGVIVGLVFGIIALVRALSDPCAHSPGTNWNKEKKLCTSPPPPPCKYEGDPEVICCKKMKHIILAYVVKKMKHIMSN